MNAVLDWFKKQVDEAQKINPGPAELTKEEMERAEASARILPSAVARLPLAVGEMAQAAHQLGKATTERSGSIIENIQRGRYRNGGFEAVQDFLGKKQAEWQAANPDATPEQVKEFTSKYQNTPEYVEFERSQIPGYARVIENASDAVDKFFGAPPDHLKTNIEHGIQTAVQTVIPINIAKNLPKAARFAVEMILPGNQAQTVAGKAGVTGLATGLSAGVMSATGRDVKPEEFTEVQKEEPQPTPLLAQKYPELNIPDGPEDHTVVDATEKGDKLATFAGVIPGGESLAIFAAIGAAVTGVRPKNVIDNAASVPSMAGAKAPTVIDEAKKTGRQIIDSTGNAFDERAPIQKAIHQATGDFATAVDTNNKLGKHSASGAGMSKRLHEDFGRIGDITTVPLKRLDAMREALVDDGAWEQVQNFLLARTEMGNRARYIDELQTDINQKYLEHTAAVNAKDIAKANDALADINKLQLEMKDRLEKRFQLQQYSTDELKDLIKNGPGDEIAQRFVSGFDDNNRAWLKQLEADRLIEPETIAKINKYHDGTYTPMIEDELGGAKGTARLFGKARLAIQRMDDPIDKLETRINPFSKREIKEGAEGAEFLMDPFNAFMRRNNQYHSWREQQLLIRDTVEAIRHGKNANEVIEETLTGSGGRTAFSDAEAMRLAGERDLSAFTPVKLPENKGKTTFIKFKDPLLRQALQMGPMQTSILGAMKHWLQRGATGTLNLGFAPMSTMLENAGIQLMRGKGTVGFVDYGVYKAAKAMGKEIPESAMQVISTASKPADFLIGQADALWRAVQLWGKVNRIRMAENLLTALETNRGWFSMMQNMPAFRAWSTKWAQNTVDKFQDTLEGALFDGKGMTYNTLSRNLEHTRELEKFIDIHIPHAARLIGAPFAEAFQLTTSMVSAYRDAAKWSHYNRQIAYNALKYGSEDKIPKDVMDSILSEVRTLTGDFSKRVGNSALKPFDDTIPYFRVMIQSTKNAYQRVSADPKLLASVMTGLVMPKVYFEYSMANWDKEAYDWYYRQTQPYERAAFVGFVRPDIMYRRAMGEEVPFKPEYIYKFYSPQEWRPITEGIAQAIRSTGAYKAGQKDKMADTTIGSQIANALGQAFGISTPPPVAALLASAGVKFDAANVFKGEHPVQVMNNPNKINDTMHTDSNVSKGMHDTLGSLFGNIGKALAQGYAAGEVIYAKTNKLDEAIWGGAREAAERIATPRAMPVPWLGDANNRRYRSTAATSEMWAMRDAFTQVLGSRAMGKAFTPQDPVLGTIAETLRQVSRDYEPKEFSQRYKELDTKIKQIENNKTVPYGERQILQRDTLKQMHELTLEQNKWMLQQQKQIGNIEIQPGVKIADAYKKMYGTEFSLKDYGYRLKKLRAKQANQ